jgi:hypothetical protein
MGPARRWAAQHVHDAAQGLLPDRHGDRRTGVGHLEAALQAVGGAQRDGPHHAVAELLLHFERDVGVVDLISASYTRGHLVAVELHVDDGADDLDNLPLLITQTSF